MSKALLTVIVAVQVLSRLSDPHRTTLAVVNSGLVGVAVILLVVLLMKRGTDGN